MYMWIGIKNLSRNKTRTFYTIGGIVLSVTLMSSAYCAIVGIAQNAYDPARKIYGGDILIMPENVTFEKVKGGYFFSDISSVLSESEVRSRVSDANVMFMYPVILRECIFFYGDKPFKDFVLGVDFETQEQAVHFTEILTQGRFFEDEEKDKFSVLLNKEMWEDFYSVGNTIKVFLPTYEVQGEEVVVDFDRGQFYEFEVVGLFTLGGRNASTILHVPITTLRDSMRADDVATYMAVTIKNFHQLDKTKKELQEQLPEYTVLSVHDVINVISEDFDRLKTFVSQLIFIMYAVSGLIVLNTMLISVEERKKEIAILRAMGAKSPQVMLFFLTEACLYGFLGALIGFFLGSLFGIGVSGMFFLNAELLLYTFGIVLVIAVLAGIYPAVRASRQPPMEGLKYV